MQANQGSPANPHSDSDFPERAAALVRARKPNFQPKLAIVLGSGLGALADQIQDAVAIPYEDLPGFPASSVQGHAGQLIVGTLAGVAVVCMKGRSHFYEGKGLDVMAVPVRTFQRLGCESVLLTCAAGSLRPEVPAGELVALSDHINLLPGTPLIGTNDERFGSRFVSLANAYDRDLRALLQQAARASAVDLHEGVYVAYSGPCFETPAEIRMMQRLGGDVVGMSTVPEAILARHCGMKVLAIASITNMGEGLSTTELTHEQTLECATICAQKLIRLIDAYLRSLPVSSITAETAQVG